MLEAEVRPMTDSSFRLPRPPPTKGFSLRSLHPHSTQCHEKDPVSFVSAVYLPDSENPVLQSMCKLLISLLRLPAAGAGMMSRGKLEYTGFARPADWAVPSLAALPIGQELLVVPDLHKDHRFSDEGKMEPARFYISAPLTSSTGMQIGALHAMDVKPRSGGLSTEEKRIFMDMVRIMSHKVEEDYTKRMEQEKHERTKDQLLQALDKIRAPICVCEIDQTDTKILFANHTWTMLAGFGEEPLVNVSVWEVLKAVDEPREEAQARFWACEVGKQDFAANFELSLHHQQLPMRLHFRSANRGAPRAVKETRGLLNQAVSKALEPSFFFAMFEQDVADFVNGRTPNPNGTLSTAASGRASIALSRAGSSFLDDDLLEATAQAAGMAVRKRRSGTVSPSPQENPREHCRDASTETQEAPTAQADPGPKGLTMEDSAEIQGPTQGCPPVKIPSTIKASSAASDQAPATESRAPTHSARKAKQPSCGCTIC